MKAYFYLSIALQNLSENKIAITVLKRLLQIAWYINNEPYEMLAYELMSKQHFYLADLKRAAYYKDRAARGKFETKTSKVRELSQF